MTLSAGLPTRETIPLSTPSKPELKTNVKVCSIFVVHLHAHLHVYISTCCLHMFLSGMQSTSSGDDPFDFSPRIRDPKFG
jgi:hypothetical protein